MTTLFALLLAANIINGNVQPLGSLSQAPANGWIGYEMPAREALNILCCGGSSNCNGCRLDNDTGFSINRRDKDDIGPIGSSLVMIFARFRDGVVDRIRAFSPTCSLDAGGQTIHWVANVDPNASVDFLRKVAESGTKRGADGALLALSLHAGARATDALIDLARHDPDSHKRGQALFWLSQQAGRKAAETLRDAVDNDPEDSVRAKAVFGIAQLPDDQSIPLLVDLMNHHRSREVRKKAAFWLGQKNDPRALAAIEDILKR